MRKTPGGRGAGPNSGGGPGTSDPGRIHYNLISLSGLVHRAFNSYFEIKSPGWMDSVFVQVDATMPPTTTKEQFQEIMQNLIVDRFQLKFHTESKELAGYALAIAKNGPKLKESAPSQPDAAPPAVPPQRVIGPDGFPVRPAGGGPGLMFSGMPGERAKMDGREQTMQDLADALGPILDTKVIDATGLKGKYDIAVIFAGHLGGRGPITADLSPPDSAPVPDLISASPAQLGLTLEKKKIRVEILVIDHMERVPAGN